MSVMQDKLQIDEIPLGSNKNSCIKLMYKMTK